jgi:hypothetical protein
VGRSELPVVDLQGARSLERWTAEVLHETVLREFFGCFGGVAGTFSFVVDGALASGKTPEKHRILKNLQADRTSASNA